MLLIVMAWIQDCRKPFDRMNSIQFEWFWKCCHLLSDTKKKKKKNRVLNQCNDWQFSRTESILLWNKIRENLIKIVVFLLLVVVFDLWSCSLGNLTEASHSIPSPTASKKKEERNNHEQNTTTATTIFRPFRWYRIQSVCNFWLLSKNTPETKNLQQNCEKNFINRLAEKFN